MQIKNQIIPGDCREILNKIEANSISTCITDPPYNYEFIGHKWDAEEIKRRTNRVQNSKTLVKNIPYGSGLAGGVRNARWYELGRSYIGIELVPEYIEIIENRLNLVEEVDSTLITPKQNGKTNHVKPYNLPLFGKPLLRPEDYHPAKLTISVHNHDRVTLAHKP